MASDATAIALKADQSPYDAIQLSELGRGIIAGSLSEMRADVSELQRAHPELAEKYIARRTQLDDPSMPIQATQRHNIAQEFEDLVKDIRYLPGFDRFLLPASEDEVKAAAIDGPVVILNISEYGCDSLIIETTSLRAVPLPQLRFEDVQARIETIQTPESLGTELLEWLWETIASPVLDALGFHDTPIGDWPHIWWIPTGLLANFPIHSAGRHCDGSSNTVLDRVISSYSTSIKALIHGRQKRTGTKESGPDHIVLVGMESTPGYSSLPFVTQEIEQLERLCKSTQMQVSRPKPFRQDVLAAMRDCSIFHFAGHGKSDTKDPLDSSLLLTDHPLTVASLFETNLTGQKPFLAYLSACGTGQVRYEELVDEGLHLVAACQLAGFQHVIGTLWEVNDESCLEITIQTYEWMQKHGINDATVSEALHRACRELRKRWVSDTALRASNRRQDQKLVDQSYERMNKHDGSNVVVDEGLQRVSIGHRGRWAFDDDLIPPSRRERRSQKCAGESRSGQSHPREARNVEAADEPPLHWVPYVHFGI